MARNINISKNASRNMQSGFVSQQPNTLLGPTLAKTSTIDPLVNAVQTPVVANVATWSVMSSFNEELRAALIDFVDTTESGKKYAHDNYNGRAKEMEFFFVGSATQPISPGSLGSFKLVFEYTPQPILGTTIPTNTL